MQKISPFLWFDDQAEEAANYYVSIFKNSEILNVSRYGEGAPRQAGQDIGLSAAPAQLVRAGAEPGPEAGRRW